MSLILKSIGFGLLAVVATFGAIFIILMEVRHFGGGKVEFFLAVLAYVSFVSVSVGAYAIMKGVKQ